MNRGQCTRARAAWFRSDAAATVARYLKLKSAGMVETFWRTEQEAGRLPRGLRPHEREQCAGGAVTPLYAIDPDAERAFENDADVVIASRDPLLAALEREHGCDPRRYEADEAFLDDKKTFQTLARVAAEARRRDAEARRPRCVTR